MEEAKSMINTEGHDDSKLYPISFSVIKLELDLIPGSSESLNFHQALDSTRGEQIFSSVAIKQLLSYKWI